MRGLSVLRDTGGYLSVVIVASFFGYVIGAYLTPDILGRRKNCSFFSVCSSTDRLASACSCRLVIQFCSSLAHRLVSFRPASTASSERLFNELSPTSVRSSGIGFGTSTSVATLGSVSTLVGACHPARAMPAWRGHRHLHHDSRIWLDHRSLTLLLPETKRLAALKPRCHPRNSGFAPSGGSRHRSSAEFFHNA